MACEYLTRELKHTFIGLPEKLPSGKTPLRGKVRDIVDLGDSLLITTSDRVSAFDRVLSTIPCKGEVLNQLALFWFRKSRKILPNHILEEVTPRTVQVRKCAVFPVEVVVRGYLTGSAWRDYTAGRAVSGISLPAGMRSDQAFSEPLLTPSTKAEQGLHDEPISSEQIVSTGLVEEGIWRRVEKAALELFRLGTRECAARGLILVDTKYEFGLLDGELILVDEIHTPDSSRFWFTDSYRSRFEAGESQRKLDKEYLRQWLMSEGFRGDGEAPEIPDEVRLETAKRYVEAFERITGTAFVPSAGGVDEVAALEARIAALQ